MKAYLLASLQEPSTWRGITLIATACGGAMTSDISGTARDPTAPPNPDFEMPVMITAGTATR